MTTTTDRTTSRGFFRDRSRGVRATLSTVPIVLASSIAMSMHLTGPVIAEPDATDRDDADTRSQLRENVRAAMAASNAPTAAEAVPAGELALAAAPASYTVQQGDTISGIAGRFGLSTASVLAMNGLGWKSVIHPGQVLVLSKDAKPVASAPTASVSSYTIAPGDTVSGIAARFGVSPASVLAANGLTAQSIIYPGQRLAIPGKSAPAALPSAPRAGQGATHHTIASGDTVTSIAQQHGVSVAALLSANGLSQNSTIYAGQRMVIPGIQAAGTVPARADAVVPMTAEMRENARIIVSVGRSLGVDEYGLVIALATAAQESSLRNLDWGDLDSVGLFQQRPSAGWGTVSQLTTPEHAARLFYGGPRNPNAGVTRGLLDIPGWRSMTVTQAAQAVQISAHPDAYAKWETSARAWLAQLG